MKHLCCSRFILILFLAYAPLFGVLQDKSAIVYYGDDISYPMVGIHDYIIVQPSLTNTKAHGFSLYRDKVYAYISIGEIDRNIKEYTNVKKEWILGENKAWSSDVLDLTNPEYQKFLFEKMIEPQMKKGFKNFFFDTLDSYHLVAKTAQKKEQSEKALIEIINTFHKRYPDSKLVINRGFEIIDKVHSSVDAVLFESYHYGLHGENLAYKKVTQSDKEWLDLQIKKIQAHNLDVIALDYLELENMDYADETIEVIKQKGMIPYVTTKELTSYGKSSKNALKREVLTLIDEYKHDRMMLGAHQYGALPLEYLGYMQKLYDVNTHSTLPKLEEMTHYAGVMIWLSQDYKDSDALIEWVIDIQKLNIKVVFMSSFFIQTDKTLFEKLGIDLIEVDESSRKTKIVTQDTMMAYEINPPISSEAVYFNPKSIKNLLTYENKNAQQSTQAAIMPWGGYAVDDAFSVEISQDNIWVINPFIFLQEALDLKTIIVPDVTTKNGKRLLFSHIDGDGMMNKVEWNPKLFSGNIILDKILKKYDVPHSVSVIGAEIESNGLYPKIAPELQKITKEMYKLDNVEPATHTFTHPFYWNMIQNDDLDEQFRLKPKGYNFSLKNETRGMLDDLNTKYIPKNKKLKAKTIFWSGDCQPPEDILKYVYENNILNINGGDTYITNNNPWLSYVAPLALQRGDYYQIYTGAQNENIYTNNWLGPF